MQPTSKLVTMLLALLMAQQEAPQPILPETNEAAWNLGGLLPIAVAILLVIALVTYVRRTRRIAEQAAEDAAAARSATKRVEGSERS